MKTKLATTLIAIAALLGTTTTVAAGPGGSPVRPGSCCTVQAVVPLGAEESATLLWMREEEKLARDVYLALHDRWQDRVFKNIASAEQRHFDALGAKIALFGLVDVALAAPGQFANAEFQEQYFSLLAAGSLSYGQALTVGATIEELDIRDLLAAGAATNNAVLRTTYGNLLDGAKNHLRAFVAGLQALGQDYAPQYLDAVLFDAIVGN